MQLSVWALSFAGFIVLSTAAPVETSKPKHFPSTTTTSLSSVSSLVPTFSAIPQNATSTTTFIKQTPTNEPGIPLPPSTVTAQIPTSNQVKERACSGDPPQKRDQKLRCASW